MSALGARRSESSAPPPPPPPPPAAAAARARSSSIRRMAARAFTIATFVCTCPLVPLPRTVRRPMPLYILAVV